MTHSEGDASLARRGKAFTVQASPFNAIKLDLALILVVGIVLLIVHERLVDDQFGQLLVVAGYGLAAMLWIVMRTRHVLKKHARAVLSGSEVGQSSLNDSE